MGYRLDSKKRVNLYSSIVTKHMGPVDKTKQKYINLYNKRKLRDLRTRLLTLGNDFFFGGGG